MMKKPRKFFFIWRSKILIKTKVNSASCFRQIFGLTKTDSVRSFQELISVAKSDPHLASISQAKTTNSMGAATSQTKFVLKLRQREAQRGTSGSQSHLQSGKNPQ
jgi:hypothetical protein